MQRPTVAASRLVVGYANRFCDKTSIAAITPVQPLDGGRVGSISSSSVSSGSNALSDVNHGGTDLLRFCFFLFAIHVAQVSTQFLMCFANAG